jgi:hypothetical protein
MTSTTRIRCYKQLLPHSTHTCGNLARKWGRAWLRMLVHKSKNTERVIDIATAEQIPKASRQTEHEDSWESGPWAWRQPFWIMISRVLENFILREPPIHGTQKSVTNRHQTWVACHICLAAWSLPSDDIEYRWYANLVSDCGSKNKGRHSNDKKDNLTSAGWRESQFHMSFWRNPSGIHLYRHYKLSVKRSCRQASLSLCRTAYLQVMGANNNQK